MFDNDIPEQHNEIATCDHCGCVHHIQDGCQVKTCPSNQPPEPTPPANDDVEQRLEQVAKAARQRDGLRITADTAQRLVEHMTLLTSRSQFDTYAVTVDGGQLIVELDAFFGIAEVTFVAAQVASNPANTSTIQELRARISAVHAANTDEEEDAVHSCERSSMQDRARGERNRHHPGRETRLRHQHPDTSREAVDRLDMVSGAERTASG